MKRYLHFSSLSVALSFYLAHFPDIASSSLISTFVPSSSRKNQNLSKKTNSKLLRYASFRQDNADSVSERDGYDNYDSSFRVTHPEREENSVYMTRRSALSSFAIATTASSLDVRNAFAIDEPGSTSQNPIVILGGSGRTGMAVAETLTTNSRYVVTTTRTGRDPFKIVRLPADIKEKLVSYENPVNVCDVDSIRRVLQETGAKGVVFAASASKAGGNASEIDDIGVENTAIACKDAGARLVLVSALAVDRPTSKSYEVTNFMGGYVNGIMDAKLRGENKVRALLKDYVIVRPGVLLSGKTRNGVLDVELNQGDTVGGGLSRDELAGVVWGAMISGKRGVTVEAYRKSTRTKLQPEFVVPSGNELSADTYVGLFENAKSDT